MRTYLEWMTEMPWGQRTDDKLDIGAARSTLDADHSGLEAVKERVLEFLALRKKTGSKKGAIIAFTGPPGVGKTSIASAIAQALGRKFVRLSLGGVHDETVLRGHGRTYLGSMPGEIMRQMKNAGTINPVMLLDEADKIGRNGNSGDPTAALLEILDPAQNNTYRDRYLDVPYDLSEVLFVVTSNELSNIPEPLRDRMEIIEFDGYTTLEKMDIAEKHIIPQKLGEHGLTTRAGRDHRADRAHRGDHRPLHARGRRPKRRSSSSIAGVIRGVAVKVAEGEHQAAPRRQRGRSPREFLGAREAHERGSPSAPPRRATATGPAWTGVGGEILFIEATQACSAPARMQLTGQLGDVMKVERAGGGLSSSADNAHALRRRQGLPREEHDLHIHIPAGAMPKDGLERGRDHVHRARSRCSPASRSATTSRTTRRDRPAAAACSRIGGLKEERCSPPTARGPSSGIIVPERPAPTLEERRCPRSIGRASSSSSSRRMEQRPRGRPRAHARSRPSPPEELAKEAGADGRRRCREEGPREVPSTTANRGTMGAALGSAPNPHSPCSPGSSSPLPAPPTVPSCRSGSAAMSWWCGRGTDLMSSHTHGSGDSRRRSAA